MPREPPVTSATRPLSENRSLNMRSSFCICRWFWAWERNESRKPIAVVPANAGTHTPRPWLLKKEDNDQRVKQLPPVVMGPCVRRDDNGGESSRVDAAETVPHRGGGAGGQH